MEPRKLQGLTFGVDMRTEKLHQGTLKLIVGRSPGVNLTPAEKTLIQKKFQEALRDLNASLSKDGISSHYQMAP